MLYRSRPMMEDLDAGLPPYNCRTVVSGVGAMATKTQRIEIRADAESQERIIRAASVVHESVSAFVLNAATAAADRVLARADRTLMPAEQFDALLATLDEPDEAPALARAAARRRRYARS